MSLFPAYDDGTNDNVEAVPSCSTTAQKNTKEDWLENSSFGLEEQQIRNVLKKSGGPIDTESATDSNSSEDEKLDTKQNNKKSDAKKTVQLDFHGDEEYYVDKKPARHYKTIDVLHKPACPRYRKYYRRVLGGCNWNRETNKRKVKRYYHFNRGDASHKSNAEGFVTAALSENEYTEKVGQLNRKTMECPLVLQTWVELIELQQQNPYKLTKLLVAERQLEIIQKALIYLPKNDTLYQRYVDIINATYPSFEVSKLIDRLLSKDPYSYTLWTAQIFATQCSMARCVVPDVLRIYERCMQKMHNALKISANDTSEDDDNVMLKLFNNCALFLRQSGLNEQFFALIKLALELNISTDKIDKLTTSDTDQATLIEYEELILQSGLPMNEIWLRIEKLRQSFNFLPELGRESSDPQRIVFNEDVCHYIYPLKSRENSFYLILLILRLLKVPFVQCDVLAGRFCARVQHIGDSDAIEDALACCLIDTYHKHDQHHEFLYSLYELAKEMSVSPTYISSNIGHEIYIKCVTQLILNSADAYKGIDEQKRIVLVLLWCRFERMLLALQKCAKKLTPEYIKAGRSRFKGMLKEKQNRNVINFYTEFALYEYESLNDEKTALQAVQNIFNNIIISSANSDESSMADRCFACITYAEILVTNDKNDDALRILLSYILNVDLKSTTEIASSKKLAALQTITKKLDNTISIEQNVDIMILEQHFIPDYTISLLKIKILLQYLLGQQLEALAYLEKLLTIFKKSSERSRFIREQIYQLYLSFLHSKHQQFFISNSLLSTKVTDALRQFPRNLYFLQCCGTISSIPWYKLRSIMLNKNSTVMSIVFLIASARYRFVARITTNSDPISSCDLKHNQILVRNRILNMFTLLTSDSEVYRHAGNALQRNPLFWRLYLCCLSDKNTAFETSKRCLLQALDECPWSKALYIDGATHVPQELSHLQDLLIEKHMRVYALPEELEILRER